MLCNVKLLMAKFRVAFQDYRLFENISKHVFLIVHLYSNDIYKFEILESIEKEIFGISNMYQIADNGLRADTQNILNIYLRYLVMFIKK